MIKIDRVRRYGRISIAATAAALSVLSVAGVGVVGDFQCMDGASFLPSDEVARKLRPAP